MQTLIAIAGSRPKLSLNRICDFLAYAILFHAVTAFGWVPGDPVTGVPDVTDTGRVQYIAYLVYLFAIFIIVTKYHLAFGRVVNGTLFLGIIAFVHLSFAWSIALGTTIQYLVRMDCLLLMMLALTTHWGLGGMIRAYSRLGVFLVCASVALFFVAPSYAQDGFGQLHGLFAHKNTFGAFAAFAGSIWLAEYFFVAKNPWKLVGILVCVLGIYLARSATAVISIFLGCVTVTCAAMISSVRRDNRVLVLAIFLLILLIAVSAIVAAPEFFLSEGLGRNETLTGRARIWSLSVDLIKQAPILGYGYHVIGDPNNHVGAALLSYGRPFTHPHNSWLATGLQLGFVGIAFQLWLYLHLTWLGIRYWWREPKRIEGIFIIVVMIGLWVRSIPESDFLLIPSFEYGLIIMLSWTAYAIDGVRYRRPRPRSVLDLTRLTGALRQI